jgi:hypothetical protein
MTGGDFPLGGKLLQASRHDLRAARSERATVTRPEDGGWMTVDGVEALVSLHFAHAGFEKALCIGMGGAAENIFGSC